MSDEPHPIAYTALQAGTPVQTADGQPFATVQSVLVDEKVAVFDGIVVTTADGARFVDAPYIGTIWTTHVATTLTADQAANLPEPERSNLIDIKPKRSKLGRMFGRK